ncbi:MAG: hypothetical protein NTX86_03975, partial [Candidatus Dependentiae bacterium]|nr:hypothetical protein [Candidatus Dependentiae bacterium]
GATGATGSTGATGVVITGATGATGISGLSQFIYAYSDNGTLFNQNPIITSGFSLSSGTITINETGVYIAYFTMTPSWTANVATWPNETYTLYLNGTAIAYSFMQITYHDSITSTYTLYGSLPARVIFSATAGSTLTFTGGQTPLATGGTNIAVASIMVKRLS